MIVLKNPVVKVLLALVAVCVALGAVYVFLTLPFTINSLRLKFEAHNNAKTLDHLTILSGRFEPSKASPNGDGLTGSNSPAEVTYKVDDTIAHLQPEISANLAKEGYSVSSKYSTVGLSETPGIGDNSAVSLIQTTASHNGKTTLLISYELKQKYYCQDHAGQSVNCNTNVVSENNLLRLKAKAVSVTYDPRANYLLSND